MEVRSFNCELAIANLLFKNIFSNIRIERSNASGNKKDVVVNCVYGLRSRILKSWLNSDRKGVEKLPAIIIERTGYTRDSSRVNNLHNEVKYEISAKNRIYDYLTPVPITISYSVTVIAKNKTDVDLIASNFMVFFNSSIYVSCVHPKYEGIKMNNQVIMDDSVSEELLGELDGSEDDFATTTFGFTFKTFLFAGSLQAKKKPVLVLSTYLSTVTNIANIKLDSNLDVISAFLEHNPDAKIFAEISSTTEKTITSYVDSKDLSDYIYDDIIPSIKSFNIGFYPVPDIQKFDKYAKDVDNTYSDLSTGVYGYISSDSSGEPTYAINTTDTESFPYVDRLVWKIDGASPSDSQPNLKLYRPYNFL